jgi:predicted house-cleaning noncanonical NTP pyrophosphatase (MazG superfamily)
VKLVRDNIPELATTNGHPGTFHLAAAEAEYALCLRAKLLEEAQEAATATTREGLLEELGDVLQVLYALAELAGCAAAEVECARARKARTHGAYTRRLLWQPPPEREPRRDTRSRRQAAPRAQPAPHPTEATR